MDYPGLVNQPNPTIGRTHIQNRCVAIDEDSQVFFVQNDGETAGQITSGATQIPCPRNYEDDFYENGQMEPPLTRSQIDRHAAGGLTGRAEAAYGLSRGGITRTLTDCIHASVQTSASKISDCKKEEQRYKTPR